MRRTGIRCGVAGLVGLAMTGIGSAAATAAEQVNWNVSLWGNPRGFTQGVEYLSRELDKRTDGNFTLRLHYGEAVSPAKENLDSVKIGPVEMAPLGVSYNPAKRPALTGPDLPFLRLSTFDTTKSKDRGVRNEVVRQCKIR